MFLSKHYRKGFEFIDKAASFLRIIHYRLKYPKLTINFASYIARRCEIICTDDSEMILHNVYLASNVHLKVDGGGRLKITDCFIGNSSVIVATESIEIQKYCAIAEMVTIRDQDHRFGGDQLLHESGLNTSPIRIGKNVWIGAKATVLRGTSIGDNSVIGANAVVTKDINENSIAVGIPARILNKENRTNFLL